MGKTKRYVPKDGDFKRLRALKRTKNKKRRAKKANLQKEVKFSNRNPNTGFVNFYEEKD